MTKDDIIRMAEEASPCPFDEGLICFEHAELITFANLVTAAEREACAQLLEGASRTGKIISCTSAAAAIRARSQS
jgi:hypothetical protein